MTEREKQKFIDYLKLGTRLKNASLNGALLMFDGRYCDAETIASACVFNDSGYYMDTYTGRPDGDAEVILVGLGDEIR